MNQGQGMVRDEDIKSCYLTKYLTKPIKTNPEKTVSLCGKNRF